MHGAKIIPFRPLRKVAGGALTGHPRHWFVTYWWFWHENLDRLTVVAAMIFTFTTLSLGLFMSTPT